MADGTIDLGPIVRSVERMASQIDSHIDQVDARLGVVAGDVANTARELQELRAEFQEFVLTAERTANVQRSETKLGTLKDDLEREYGHYAIVRRSSIGTLQAFDVGNVSNKTVQQVSEELMIQTPRYWLAPALVALAAWSRDDKSLADKSIDAAFSRDSVKTGLFFALVLRRQGRLESAARWLRHYFTSLDPRALTRDFAVVLEAAAQDAFGPAGRDLVLRHLQEWSALLRDDDAIVAAQIDTWYAEVSVQRGVVDDSLFPRLVETSPQWPQLKDVLERSSASGNVAAKYQAVLDAPVVLSAGLEDRMDDLLEQLVTEYDTEELPLRREILFHEAVLESSGDLTRAREASDAAVEALDEALDALSLVTHAALHPKLLGVSANTQKLSIGAGKSDFRTAVGRYTADYRAANLSSVDIVLGPTHTGYASAMGFGTWKTTTDIGESQAEASLSITWDATVAEYIERARMKNSVYVIAGLITLGVALFGLLFPLPWGLLIGLILAGGISAIVVWTKKTKADAMVAKAEADRDAAKAASIAVYREATAEYLDLRLAYADEDAKEAALLTLIDKWPSFELEKEQANQ